MYFQLVIDSKLKDINSLYTITPIDSIISTFSNSVLKEKLHTEEL